MPDFCARREGLSKSLKDAYVHLRQLEFPDKDIFIFAEGEFNRFKGEILEQQPQAGDMVYLGERITLMAAVPGICQLMPDLFTDHIGGFHYDMKNPRQGTKNLFAIFDSMFLKMLCRLGWVRDIYAGICKSDKYLNYLNSMFFLRENEAERFDSSSLGFILPRLSRYQGTDNAIRILLETITGLKVVTKVATNQKMAVPGPAMVDLGKDSRLGENMFLGVEFEGEKPELDICFKLDRIEDVQKVLQIIRDNQTLEGVLNFVLPHSMRKWDVSVKPDSDEIAFVSGNSHLGVSTALKGEYSESG